MHLGTLGQLVHQKVKGLKKKQFHIHIYLRSSPLSEAIQYHIQVGLQVLISLVMLHTVLLQIILNNNNNQQQQQQ